MDRVKKLEVCISNLELGTQTVWDKVAAEYPDIRLVRWGCMGYCHRCIHVPYVLLNDTEYIESDSVDTLTSKVLQRIQEGE